MEKRPYNKNESATSTAPELPPEIWYQILLYLNHWRFGRLKLVCKDFAHFYQGVEPIKDRSVTFEIQKWCRNAKSVASKIFDRYVERYPRLGSEKIQWSYASSSDVTQLENTPVKFRISLCGQVYAGKRTLLSAIRQQPNGEVYHASPRSASVFIRYMNSVFELAFECEDVFSSKPKAATGEVVLVHCVSLDSSGDIKKLLPHCIADAVQMLVFTKLDLDPEVLPIMPSDGSSYLEVSAKYPNTIARLMNELVYNLQHYLQMYTDKQLLNSDNKQVSHKLDRLISKAEEWFEDAEQTKLDNWKTIPLEVVYENQLSFYTVNIFIIGPRSTGKASLINSIMPHALFISCGKKEAIRNLTFTKINMDVQWDWNKLLCTDYAFPVLCFAVNDLTSLHMVPDEACFPLIICTHNDLIIHPSVSSKNESRHYLEVSSLTDDNIDKIVPTIISLIPAKILVKEKFEDLPPLMPCERDGDTVRLFKLVLVGDYGVGKTKLLHALKLGEASSHIPNSDNIGTDFFEKCFLVNGAKVCFQMWDTAGSERYRNIGSSFYRGANVVLVCYSIIDRASADHVKHWASEADNYGMSETIVIAVGTKMDQEYLHCYGRSI